MDNQDISMNLKKKNHYLRVLSCCSVGFKARCGILDIQGSICRKSANALLIVTDWLKRLSVLLLGDKSGFILPHCTKAHLTDLKELNYLSLFFSLPPFRKVTFFFGMLAMNSEEGLHGQL